MTKPTDEKRTVTVTCTDCKKNFDIIVTLKGLKAWEGGMLIQNAFPELSSAHRELLLNDICNPCWDALFPPEER